MDQGKSLADLTWPLGLTAAMAVVIAFNVYLATVAVRTDKGFIDLAPYERGVGFEAILKGRREFANRGWRYQISSAPHASSKDSITVVVQDSQNTPVKSLSIQLTLKRPHQSVSDRELSLTESTPGTYVASVPEGQLAPGLWLYRISLRSSDLTSEFDGQLVIE